MSTDNTGANLLAEDLETTWATRNPLKPTIAARINVNGCRNTAQSLAAHQRKVVRDQQAEALKQEIQVAHAIRKAEVDRLCKEYSRKKDYIESLLNHAINYMLTHQPSFYNALVHHMSQELNEGEQKITHRKFAHLNYQGKKLVNAFC